MNNVRYLFGGKIIIPPAVYYCNTLIFLGTLLEHMITLSIAVVVLNE